MKRELQIVAGPDEGRTFSLEDGQTLIIGRGQASDTVINDPRISRVHCQVEVDGGTTRLMDKGSSSGTWVREQKVSNHELQPGEVFSIGDTQIRYRIESSTEATTMKGSEAFGRPKPQPKIAPLNELVGQSFAHYRLDSIIAQGNAGMVFKAHDTEKETRRRVLQGNAAGSWKSKRGSRAEMGIAHFLISTSTNSMWPSKSPG